MALSADLIRQTEMEHVRHIIDRDKAKGNFFTKVTSPINLPRLQRFVTIYSRLEVPDETHWVADGTIAGTLEAAVNWINAHPLPEVTIVERSLLDMISDEYEPSPAAPSNLAILRLKGLIEYENDSGIRCRRTSLAKKVIQHAAAD